MKMFENITLDGLYILSSNMTEKQKEDFFPKVFERSRIDIEAQRIISIALDQIREIDRRNKK